MSGKLLEEFPAEKILAALLKYAFKEMFDESMYTEISRQLLCRQKRQNQAIHCHGKSRRHDSGKIVRVHPGRNSETANLKVRDAEIFPHFSFVTVPFAQAETLLEIFKNKIRGRKPFVELAQKSKGNSSKNKSDVRSTNSTSDTRVKRDYKRKHSY